jgi:hypothetical protein
MKFSKGEIFFLIALFLFGFSILLLIMQNLSPHETLINQSPKRWQIESIDTMKYSRDMARADLTNPDFGSDVQKQMSAIAQTGANYVAIDTPYDDEFLPVLQVWVSAARQNGLHVWFRGNFSGWEGWFGYSRITEEAHLEKTKAFILQNPDLFQDGDIFSSCPECENGANLNPGDMTAVINHRKFIIEEYGVTTAAFKQINKNVASNYFSMNADVARAVMDQQTTQALNGVVVIDHYVLTPQQLASDVSAIAAQSGGKIVLGEFGAPIPNIHGQMTNDQQASWIQESLQLLTGVNKLIGVNYWVNMGGSTALWNTDGTPKPAVSVIKSFYQ